MMPDIAICGDDKCPFSQQCKRHPDSGTVPSKHQVWVMFEKVGPPTKPENCRGFYPSCDELERQLTARLKLT